MHEAAIAISIIEAVTVKCREGGYNSVLAIRVRVGAAAGVLPEALSFAFAAARGDTLAAQAELVIEEVPVGGVCQTCGRPFAALTGPYVLACPLCGSASFTIDRGFELEIVDMEVQ
ncbi:MAG: hydrogenase maturation nickel metallochaperone HypA [Desulfobacteraceae bacterium]|nr:MAG: hydrogenase maturation nickel metallochaperone HypA [Desulfobacteraceae bacterium]